MTPLARPYVTASIPDRMWWDHPSAGDERMRGGGGMATYWHVWCISKQTLIKMKPINELTVCVRRMHVCVVYLGTVWWDLQGLKGGCA